MKVQLQVDIHAILFKVDVGKIFDVQLKDGYVIKKLSLFPMKDALEEVFDISHDELRRQYTSAVIDDELNVPCACKTTTVNLECVPDELSETINEHIITELNVLDRQLREIRLLTESPICFKTFRFVGKVTKDTGSYSTSLSSNIPEAYANTKDYATIWKSDDIVYINKFLEQGRDEDRVQSQLWTSAHGLYDSSYFQLNNPNSHANALTHLVICMETLFIGKNEKIRKKQALSKRAATYIAISEEDRKNIYNDLVSLYKLRSNYVHDGDMGICADDVILLRSYVRRALLKYQNEDRTKREIIASLKEQISNSPELEQCV